MEEKSCSGTLQLQQSALFKSDKDKISYNLVYLIILIIYKS